MAMRIQDFREISAHYTELDDVEEPTDAEISAAMDDLAAVNVMAWNEAEWRLAEAIRAAMADAHLATIETYGAPF